MKYVMLLHKSYDCQMPVLFADMINHKTAAHAFIADGWNPVAAGFYDVGENKTFGSSVGLGLHPQPTDAKIIRLHFAISQQSEYHRKPGACHDTKGANGTV